MEKISENRVLRIPAGSSNVYLVKNGKESVLVDAGNKNKGKNILKKLKSYGVEPSDIALIVVTHCHYDHVGSLAFLKEQTGAKVLVHEAEAENLKNGYLELPDGTNAFSRFVVWLGRTFFSSMGKFEPVVPDITINSRYDPELDGFDGFIIPTPGHTQGSITLIFENQIAMVGDTAFNMMQNIIYPPFANDQQKLMESWESLLQTNVRYVYPGHGKGFSIDRLISQYEKR